MKSALMVASPRGAVDFREALRLQETVQALDAAGWRVDLLVPRPAADLELPDSVTVHSASRAPFAGELPERPSLRRIAICRMMFIHGACLASRNSYSVFFGTDDGAVAARRICRLAPGRRYIAEVVRPFSLTDRLSSHGIAGWLSRRAERDAIGHADAVVFREASFASHLDAPLPRSRVSTIPDPSAGGSGEEFGFGDFDAAMLRVFAYASSRP